MTSADRILRTEIPLVVGDGQSVPNAPVNTGKTEQAVLRNGQWVEFWSTAHAAPHAPVADFTWAQSAPSASTTDVSTGVTGISGTNTTATTVNSYTVSFNGLASFEIGGQIVAWDWTFGDGAVGTGSSPSHVYAGAQTYSVSLKVTDARGATAVTTKPITISSTPVSQPTARFTQSMSGYTVSVDGSASSSTNGASIARWDWTFGDGATGTGPTTTHTYPGGTYTLTLTVTDSNGYTGSSSVKVTTTNTAPKPSFTTTITNLAVAVDASASSDPDGTIASYAWDWGDGTGATGRTASHTYPSNGTYSIKLTLTDNLNSEATLIKTVSVSAANNNPIASFTASPNGLTLSVDGSASTDPGGSVTAWAWNFGDGSTGTGVTATHTYASAGTRTVTLTVTDNLGATGSTSQSVTTATADKPPVPSFTASASGLTASVNASASTDPDGTIASYAWAFGDGGTATGVTASHTYSAANTYTVKLTVTDNQGVSASITKAVTVSTPATDYIIGAASASSTFVPPTNAAVLQNFVRSPDTGQFYMTQKHDESNGVESVRLTRLASDGTAIDSMMLTYAGHGTTFCLEYTGGKMYIWLNWRKATDGTTDAFDIVRFPYAAGTFTRSQVAGLTVKIAGPTYRLPAFDYRGGWAVIRTVSGATETYTRYPLANVMAGSLTGANGSITLPSTTNGGVDGLPTMQGFATYYDSLFRYTGLPYDDPNASKDPPRIVEYAWATDAVVRTIDASSFRGAKSGEPEGMSIYNTGNNPVLFFGFSMGPIGGPHTYPTWWYPLYNPDSTGGGGGGGGGNTVKSPWLLGTETEGLPSTVRVVKWSSIATSSSDDSNPNVALNRLTADSVVDISGEHLTIPNFTLGLSSTNYFPTALAAPHFLGFIGGINNGVFDNSVQLKPNALTTAQATEIASQTSGTSKYAVIRPGLYGSKTWYMMGVNFIGADQQRVTEVGTGGQYRTGPARYKGLDFDHAGNGSIIQNCLFQAFNYADGSTPPWEVGMIDSLRSNGVIVRRVEMDGILPVGSPSRPTSTTADPFGFGWKRSGGFQWNADKSPHMYDFSIHSGLVSGLTYSVGGTSNNGTNNTADIYIKGLYVEDQSTHGFSGINLEDVLSSIYIENATFKMNSTGGLHIKMNNRLQNVIAPNIPSSNFRVIEPTWNNIGYNGMFVIGITLWGTKQTSAPTVVKNGINLTGTTSTTADPARYYYIKQLN